MAANLADPKTDLTGFIGGLGRTMRVVAPVSKTNARLFTTMANTFDALYALYKTAIAEMEETCPGSEQHRRGCAVAACDWRPLCKDILRAQQVLEANGGTE